MKTLQLNLIINLLFLPSSFQAQTYGNEWIDYSQTYYHFNIFNNGIYQLDYATLDSAGVPLNTFQSENIQIFGKERELPIHIEDGGDNSIDPGDYILFYAERNDGWLDSTIYIDSSTIGNPAYSLYNDTLTYFFTWNSSTNNHRYTVETDINFSNYSSITNFITCKKEIYATQEYYDGTKDGDASISFYTAGEGWGSSKQNGAGGGHTTTLNFSTPFPYVGNGAPLAHFTGLSISASNAPNGGDNHHLQWTVGATNTELYNTTWEGYAQQICNASFSSSLLSSGFTTAKFNIIDDLGAATDYQAYQFASIEYPSEPNFNGSDIFEFEVINDPQGKVRLDITAVAYNTPLMLIHGDVPRMVPLTPNGTVHSVLIPNSSNGTNQKVIYRDYSTVTTIPSVKPVNGNGNFQDFTTLNLERALILIHHPILASASAEYETYRSSQDGGGHTTVLANIDELYLQFGGGIHNHINGVRRFAHFIYNSVTVKPIGLFLMGKGIREASYNITTSDGPGTRKNPIRFAASLIPSFGQPSSDVAITAGLEGSKKWVPLIPTGRISVRTNDELMDYLNKVKAYEIEQDPMSVYDSPNKDWQKQVIHFAGGSNSQQQSNFQGYLNNLETTVSSDLYGANVMRVYKSTSNPLDPTILTEVTDRISNGVSLMSYFGHASGTNSGFEINLDNPVSWNNQGKYPVMLVNSCYNGNIFQMTNSKSEEFVQIPDYGAIAYIASVGLGYSSSLYNYSEKLYDRFTTSMYGETIAACMQATIGHMEQTTNDAYSEATAMQMALNGDPMLRLNTHQKPEIEITPQSIAFSPAQINLATDSLEIKIDIKNLGHSISDTFNLIIERNFPNSQIDSLYILTIPELNYIHTVKFKMPVQPAISIGENIFTVRVDIPSFVDEQYDEVSNNQVVVTKYISIDGITPIIPYEFAVVPDDSVSLRASTINPIADYEVYRFEIDTVDFEGTNAQSEEHRYALIAGLGGVKEVHPSNWIKTSTGLNQPLVCTDSTVYFWRVAIEGDTNWRESSFQYIHGETGWGQDHFYQFKKNGFFNINYDRNTRKRYFQPTLKELECNVNDAPSGNAIYENNVLIDGNLLAYGVEVSLFPKFQVVVIDPITLKHWGVRYVENGDTIYPNNNFGNNNDLLYNLHWKYFTFYQNNPAQLTSFQNMVLNEVPDGHYLLIYSPMNTRFDLINTIDSTNFYQTFAALGSDSIVGGIANQPFAFFTKKGEPNSVIELFGNSEEGQIHLLADMIGADDTGEEHSTLIGPASKWSKVYWKQNPSEIPTSDTTRLLIKGFNSEGIHQLTIDTLFTSNDSIMDLETLVNAIDYPYLNLNAKYTDSDNYTPAQVDRWHVLFEPLPEAAIDGSNPYIWSTISDTISEGQEVLFAVDVRNIYSVDMDSLLIDYWTEDASNNKNEIAYLRQDSLRVNETLRDTITIETTGMAGLNSFWMEVNPYVNGSFIQKDQPEQQHFNNILQIPFYVTSDEINPILDVTFNGNHILNGDIVDPYSEVLITLKDENEFLIMDDISDTTLFGVYLTDPSGAQTRIPFMDGNGATVMMWTPATAQNKRFKINWSTNFTADGTYTLFVQGADKSGNISGDIEYQVEFEIVHESTITQMMNYPNPFSTSTRFIFTLTGSEVPDDILIQIMTVSGKVVREITESELGQLQIGRNITAFSWNGTDEYGDPLANGVYLYRVKAKINGVDIKLRKSGADNHFKKGFGKMYLMR